MSKTTKQPTSTSTVSVNGTPKIQATTNSDGGISSNYYMSPWEQEAYEYSQKEFAKNLPNVNVFSEETLKNLSDQIDAYKAKGIKQINDVYAPMLKNLQNDIASRFGNLDNSVFLDKLGKIEDKRADSVSSFAQDVNAKEQSLVQNELANRYNYLSFLNGYQNQMLQNAMGATSTGQSMLNSSISLNNGTNSNTSSELDNQLNSVLFQGFLSSIGIPI